MTANDLITAAMAEFNGIEPGETPTAAEAAAGLANLNGMIDSWQAERLMIFAIQRQVFPLTLLKQTYTLGPGGDFNVPRPARIDRMGIISQQNPSQPLELPLAYYTDEQWSRIPVKTIYSSLPSAVWDDQGYPWRNLNFWCIPNMPVSVAIYTWAALSSFQDLVTDYTFPPGYADALRYNLAFRFAGQFGPYMPPQLPALAVESKGRVKSMNEPLLDMRCDEALVATGQRIYNWITDR